MVPKKKLTQEAREASKSITSYYTKNEQYPKIENEETLNIIFIKPSRQFLIKIISSNEEIYDKFIEYKGSFNKINFIL